MIDFLQHAYILIWLILWLIMFYFMYDSETSFLWNLGSVIILGLILVLWPITVLVLWAWNKAKKLPYPL